jgi:hypothetical protein
MADDRQLFVLCDTNAAVRDAHLFRKKGGPLLVEILRAKKGKLVVPEVLRMEYISQFIEAGFAALQKATTELDRLKTFCGYDISALLPKRRFAETQALEILAQLEDVIHIIPSSPDLKVAAADRAINGIRPTSKTDHGYKDCLIWESLLTLPRGAEVLFISRDATAFFDGGGLAPNLAKDVEEKGLILTAYSLGKDDGLMPVVNALKEKFSDIAASMPSDVPMGAHPIIQAYMQAEPVAPVLPKDPTEVLQPLVAAAGELEKLFEAQTRTFTRLDIKALGFVSYMRITRKRDVIGLLGQSGEDIDAARNALERLALAEVIRDTGNNYLVVEGRLSDMAAQVVEPEMIKVIGLGAG